MKLTLKKRYLFITLFFVIVIVILLVTGDGQRQYQRSARALITIDTTEITTHNYDVEMNYIGTLYPANEFAVHSKVSGRIIDMFYDIGDKVENGSTIAKIDDTEYQLDYKQAEGKLAMERSKVQQKQMAIDLAEREFQRMTALREEKVISESQLEKAEYDFERQRVTFDMDQASLANQETSVEISNLRLSYTNIQAKWAEDEDTGTRVLADRFVDVGEIINTNKPIASIMEIGLLKAEIFVGEKEYPKFEMGMQVSIEVDAFPDQSFEGEVERVAPFLNEQTRQAKVLILVKNDDLRLRPGMFARARVIFDHRENVKMLPKECIIEWRNEDGVYLYDAEEQRVLFRRVEVGDVHGDYVEVLNDRVINLPVVRIGQHMVRPSMKVNHADDVSKEEPAKGRANPAKAAGSDDAAEKKAGAKMNPEKAAIRKANAAKKAAKEAESAGEGNGGSEDKTDAEG